MASRVETKDRTLGWRAAMCCAALMLSIDSRAADESETKVQHQLAQVGYDIASEHCGPNARRSRQQVKNRHDGDIVDERETIRCRGLVLVVYHAHLYKPPHELLESMTLHGAHPRLPKSISPGATRRAVLAYAGPPMRTDRNSLVYLLNDEGPDQHTARLEFRNDRLARITWSWSDQ